MDGYHRNNQRRACLLEVDSVEKYYGSPQAVTKALDQIGFRVQAGEYIAVMGASGSGKTTLLNCISTIDTVSSGRILLDGRDITAIPAADIAAFRREALGFVFQEFNLLDTLTLEENIALPLTVREMPQTEIREKVHVMAHRLGLWDALGKFPCQVSGGQKQRCAFARAVIGEPKLILADEPTGSLDSDSAGYITELLIKSAHVNKRCVIAVTHSNEFADQADVLFHLKNGNLIMEKR